MFVDTFSLKADYTALRVNILLSATRNKTKTVRKYKGKKKNSILRQSNVVTTLHNHPIHC